LHYNRYRYYDPLVGRYLSPDPLGLAAGLNTYAYVPNTSGWIDPYGLANKRCPTGKKIYRELSAEDRALLDAGKTILPKGTGDRGAKNIVKHVQGGDTGLISTSLTKEATRKFKSGHGLVEIDVDQLEATGSTVIDHGNVMQAVRREGRAIDIRNATESQEVMIKGGIDPSAVRIIEDE
jgi:uncharacterized protein RhaS with RHS repeats